MNHYEWLEKYFPVFLRNLGILNYIPYSNSIITADGDKCYSYKNDWEDNNIPFNHGVAIYLLSKLPNYSHEVRETINGWVSPDEWVIKNYNRFKSYLPDEN